MTKISVKTKLKAVEEYANGDHQLGINTGLLNMISKFGWEFMQDLVKDHYSIHPK